MKPIEITTKFKPFSHEPGISVPYPLLKLVFVIYPTKLKILDWKSSQKVLLTLKFKYKTFCQKFTVFSDIIKQSVEICCELEDNFAKLKLAYDEKKESFYLSLERYNGEFLGFEVIRPGKTSVISRQLTKKKPLILFKNIQKELIKNPERLFLGSHKKQEIERIFARKDICEFLPLWYLWGQFCKSKPIKEHKEGTLIFLNHLQECLQKKEHHEITAHLKNIISSSFAPMMIPYLEDFKHWGFFLPKQSSSKTSPWILLSELYHVIRQFFIYQNQEDLYILRHLPPELFSGKLVNVQQGHLTLHLEWTKKMIRRMIIFASKSTTIHLHFSGNVKTFRVKDNKSDRGKIFENNSEFTFKRNRAYFFDCFEK